MLVVMRVFLALRGARVAGSGARPAEFLSQWSATRHRPRGRRARVGAISVELYARHQHSHVLLVKTGVSAHFAGDQTLETCLEALVKVLA